jgi:hypothetical protein
MARTKSTAVKLSAQQSQGGKSLAVLAEMKKKADSARKSKHKSRKQLSADATDGKKRRRRPTKAKSKRDNKNWRKNAIKHGYLPKAHYLKLMVACLDDHRINGNRDGAKPLRISDGAVLMIKNIVEEKMKWMIKECIPDTVTMRSQATVMLKDVEHMERIDRRYNPSGYFLDEDHANKFLSDLQIDD